MRQIAHLVALIEMREEQLNIHLCSVRTGSGEARRIRSLLATMQMRKRALKQFPVDDNRARKTMTVH
jgi:hypothetical protein